MLDMIPNVLRNLVNKKATRSYPTVVCEPFEGVRGELRREAARCTHCGICARKCPAQCIRVSKPEALWQYDPAACVYCGTCVESCPEACLLQGAGWLPPFTDRQQLLAAVAKPGEGP